MGTAILPPDRFFAQQGQHRLRVLVVAAQPFAEARPLDLRREWADLERALRDGAVPVSLARLNPPTLAGLERALRRCQQAGVAPHVLHFAGHGEPRKLLFEDELGGEAWVDRGEVERVLKGTGVRALLLNACHSASLGTIGFAQKLVEAKAVEAAIGHEVPVGDADALAFSRVFYQRLAVGESVFSGFVDGREAMASPEARAAVRIEGEGRFKLEAAGTSAEVRTADGRPERFVVAGAARFFGRAREAVEIGGWIADGEVRAVAITGMGGIGKSSLARQVAERHAWRFPGGVVEATARLIFEAPTAAALLGQAAVGLRRPQTAGATALVQDLLAHAGEAPTLFLFDNLEDLAGEELERLLRFAELVPPGSKVLLTLRPAPEALGGWAWLRALPLVRGLSGPAAVDYALHLGRGKGQDLDRPPPGVAGGATVAAWLASATAGHPKMLELAVGLLATRGLDAARAALPEEAPGAETVELAQAAIQKALEELFRHTFDRLDAAGQAVARVLPLLPTGSVTDAEGAALLAAVEEVEAAEAAARFAAGAEACVKAGLLARAGDVLRFHPTVDQYVRQHLPLAGEAAKRGFGALVDRAVRYVAAHRAEYPTMSRRIDHVLGLFEQAWGLGDTPLRAPVVQAVGALGYYLQAAGRWAVYEAWRPRLAADEETPAARSSRLYRDALHAFNRGQPGEARRLLGEVIRTKEELGDHRGRAASLHELASIEFEQGKPGEARRLLGESIRLFEELGNHQGRAASLHELARIESAQGKPGEARRLLGESIRIKEELGDHRGRGASLHVLATIESAQGNPGEARRLLGESIRIKEELGDHRGRAASLVMLGQLRFAEGERAEGLAQVREAARMVGGEVVPWTGAGPGARGRPRAARAGGWPGGPGRAHRRADGRRGRRVSVAHREWAGPAGGRHGRPAGRPGGRGRGRGRGSAAGCGPARPGRQLPHRRPGADSPGRRRGG
ncbi:MAG: tetratricopeptide repeat protein [Myxococcales bacterium]|nr:tetratricopeptide repeat protein [Myxococcales bacterium]